ncbi:hypothetical protein BCR42DRAFT_451838 [Absidia repens]|uniref:Uncharacterized protein n=1 Tax=Absidia repens TaxID=90262 RepID=A0A1X2IHV6_9FUNG|nr:hypothetical protein BCR42DRAFT_451838 [Absidia repens]
MQTAILMTAVANEAHQTRRTIFGVCHMDKALVDRLNEQGYGDHMVLIPEDWFH